MSRDFSSLNTALLKGRYFVYSRIMKKYLVNIKTWSFISILVLDGLFFGLTNPSKSNSFLLIVGFILFGLTTYLVIYCLFRILLVLGIKTKFRQPLTIYSSLVITLLVVLQSLGQLSIRDTLVTLLIAAIGCFYFLRLKSS